MFYIEKGCAAAYNEYVISDVHLHFDASMQSGASKMGEWVN